MLRARELRQVSIPFLTGPCLLLGRYAAGRPAPGLCFNPLPNGAVSAPMQRYEGETRRPSVGFNPLPNGAVSAPEEIDLLQRAEDLRFNPLPNGAVSAPEIKISDKLLPGRFQSPS